MAVRTLEVFLASRFEEFGELRRILVTKLAQLKNPPAKAIDLNDNYPDARPPIDRCCESIDSADIVVLLIGDTYSDKPLDGESYTHLEYRHARRTGKNMLTFLIGEGYAKSSRWRPPDPRLSEWIDEMQDSQGVRRYDSRLGWNRIGQEIYEFTLERLWEAAEAANITDLGEEGSENWEESPIRLHEITARLKSAGRGRTLRSLALEHAHEAVEALEMNFPQIAIHHLKRTDDLVPLEPVSGYWLSRLLLTGNRRGEWKAARLIALRCAAIARVRPDGLPDLLRMACWIVAARASERLGERTPALQHAQDAYDDKGFHWLAKLELSRQLAIDGKAAEAFRHATEAFWLKPGVIYKIQTDPVFMQLGDSYRGFRKRLRDDVREETTEVTETERLLVQFAGLLGIPATAPEVGQRSQHESLLSMIAAARESAQRSLQLFRQCGARLVANAGSFESGPYKGLKRETEDQIAQSIATDTGSASTLASDLSKQMKEQHRLREKLSVTIGVGVMITLASAFVTGVLLDHWPVTDMLVMAGGIVLAGGAITWGLAQQAYRQRVSASDECQRLKRELDVANSRVTVARTASALYEQQASILRTHLSLFCRLVQMFEETAGRHLAYSPGVPRKRENATDLVRVDARESDEAVALPREGKLLPPDLAAIVGDAGEPLFKYWFGRRLDTAAGQVLSRQAAYFPS